MGKNTDELRMLQKEIDAIPESNTARPAWKALGFVMTALKGTMDEYTEDFAAFKEDVSERFFRLETKMIAMEGDIKLIQNNTNTTKNIVTKLSVSGNGNGKIVEEILPERKWFIDKVLPGLVQTGIIAFITVIITLVVSHYAP